MTGLLAGLAAMTMLFAAFSSAYIVRRGLANDWVALSLPAVTYLSFLPGLVVSVFVEIARRRNRKWLIGAALLGFVFLYMMHAYAWHRVVHESNSPASAFFFVINGSLMVATVGGMIALYRARLTVLACYWHYLNVLWIMMLGLFYLWP